MPQPANFTANVKWIIEVPSEFAEDVRVYLASHKEGSLSSLIQKSVSTFIVASLTREAKNKVQQSGLSHSGLDNLVAQGLAWAKEHPQ